jgi:hypothetical protein
MNVPKVVGVVGGGRMGAGPQTSPVVRDHAAAWAGALGKTPVVVLVGLDVRLAIAEHLHRELGERFAPPRLLRDMVARGELGRKAGQGFFSWEAS